MNASQILNLLSKSLLVVILILIQSCSEKEEIKPDVKPIKILTLPAGNVSATSATLNAEIGYLNDEKVLDYGFIVSNGSNSENKKISIGNQPKTGLIQYEYKPTQKFQLNQNLNYNFYLITDKQEYSGYSIAFTIKDFWVDQQDIISIALGDTLTLTGNFKQLGNDYKVFANSSYNPTVIEIIKIEDSKLTLKIPTGLGRHGDRVNLFIAKDSPNPYYGMELSLVTLNLLGKIEFDVDKPIYYGEGLKIHKYGIDYFSSFLVLVGNAKLGFDYSNENLVKLQGIKYNGQKLRLGYFNGVDTIISNKKLELIQPTPSDFTFNESMPHPGNIFTINRETLEKYFGMDNFTIKIADSTAIESYYDHYPNKGYYLPYLKQGKYNVQIVSDLYPALKLEKQIDIKPISSKIINQKPYFYGDDIEISGNFVDGAEYIAKITDYETITEKAMNGRLKIKLPHGDFGNHKLYIGMNLPMEGYQFVEPGIPIEIQKSIIDSFTPLSAYAGDIITIKGKGLKTLFGTNIYIADIHCNIISISETEIKIMAPNSFKKGKFSIDIYFSLENALVQPKELLELK